MIATAEPELRRRPSRVVLPTVGAYLLREFGRGVVLCLLGFIALYLCVDFFERFRSFLDHGASAYLIVLYFLLKIPRIVTEMMPAAVLAGVLLSVGALARRNEIMALRACGISLWQISAPIVVACLALSLVTLFWNEYVVPECATRARYVERVAIKKKEFPGHFRDSEIWVHGKKSFTNIDRFDAKRGQVHGIKRYEFDDQFHLVRMVTASTATWTAGGWTATDAQEVVVSPDGQLSTRQLSDAELGLAETPDDFGAVYRDPEDLSFRDLQREIADLRRKGIDTTDATVSLWLKLAIPFIGLVMALLALPLATRRTRNASTAANVGLALVVGFAYWVVLALSMSLGRTGVIPAPIAAWSANAIFAAIGAIFFLGSE